MPKAQKPLKNGRETGDLRVRFLQELFDLAGNSTKLAAELDLHAFTVENWRKSGIPLKYWDRIKRLYGLSTEELYKISRHCRESFALRAAAKRKISGGK